MGEDADRAARLARELLALWGTGAQRGPLGVSDMAEAGRVTARLKALREARGERVAGRKIGFTNAALWPLYGVDGPMWSHVWDATLAVAGPGAPAIELSGLPEPRIEPEIAFLIGRTPEPGMDEAALIGCVEAVTHGFEIVQSVFPGWRFTGPDSAAAFGLHGRLALGPWRGVASDRDGWRAALETCEVRLTRDGETLETGAARAALGGPLRALGFLVGVLADDPEADPLAPGEVVTTGTMTDAWPVRPGETWSTEIAGADLAGLRLRFAGPRLDG